MGLLPGQNFCYTDIDIGSSARLGDALLFLLCFTSIWWCTRRLVYGLGFGLGWVGLLQYAVCGLGWFTSLEVITVYVVFYQEMPLTMCVSCDSALSTNERTVHCCSGPCVCVLCLKRMSRHGMIHDGDLGPISCNSLKGEERSCV